MLTFEESAWEDYLYFKNRDKSISKKIDKLIKVALSLQKVYLEDES